MSSITSYWLNTGCSLNIVYFLKLSNLSLVTTELLSVVQILTSHYEWVYTHISYKDESMSYMQGVGCSE